MKIATKIATKNILWSLTVIGGIAVGVGALVLYHFLFSMTDYHREFRRAHPEVTVLSAEFAALYSLEPPPISGTDLEKEVSSSPLLHDYPVKLPWHSIGAHDLQLIHSLMTNRSLYAQSGLADCFDPGFAIRSQTDHGPFDLLVCLKCHRILIVAPNGRFAVPMSELGILHWKAFFVDAFVMKSLVGTSP